MALKSANLHIPTFTPSSFRVWTHFDLSNVTKPEIKNLKKLVPAPNIPIDQLRAQIAIFRQITTDKDRPWICYVGGGSGSGSSKVVFLWNRTLLAFVDKLSSTTVDFIRSEGEMKDCISYG